MGCSGSRHTSTPSPAPPLTTAITSNKRSDHCRGGLSTIHCRGFKVDEILRDCIIEEFCVDTSEFSAADIRTTASSDDSHLSPKNQLIHHCKVSIV